MDIKNCEQCGKMFRSLGLNICPECVRENEKEFEKVKDYLKKHKGASISEVVEATGVEYAKIIDYLKDKRLEISGREGEILLRCESCGEPINTGRYCGKCLKNLHDEISGTKSAMKKEVQEEKHRNKTSSEEFRIVDRYKK